MSKESYQPESEEEVKRGEKMTTPAEIREIIDNLKNEIDALYVDDAQPFEHRCLNCVYNNGLGNFPSGAGDRIKVLGGKLKNIGLDPKEIIDANVDSSGCMMATRFLETVETALKNKK